MKNIFIIAIVFISSFKIVSASVEKNTSIYYTQIQNIIDTKNNDYYSGNYIIKPTDVRNIINEIETNTNITQYEKLSLKLECYALWANVSISAGTFKDDYKELKNIYFNIRKQSKFWNASYLSIVYSSFAWFANSMIPLSFFTKSPFSYIYITDTSIFSKLGVLKDKNNLRANFIYALSSSIAINYTANNTYSSSIKILNNTEMLPQYLIFLSHIYKSMANIKVNKTKEAFIELNKSRNIYPNAFFVHMLEGSYATGGNGFDSITPDKFMK